MKFQTAPYINCHYSPKSLKIVFVFTKEYQIQHLFKYKDGLRVFLVFIIFWASLVLARDPDVWNDLKITSASESDTYIGSLYNRFEPMFESWDDNKTSYIALGTAIGSSFLLDGIISRDTNWVASTGNWLGDKEGIATLIFAPILLGKMLEDEYMVEGGLVAAESMIYAGLMTQGIKLITGRTRPDGSDNMSFPSGHVSSVAAFAASVSEWYDWRPEIAIPLHILPLAAVYSRPVTFKHYPSDVFAGFILGEVIGIYNSRWRKNHDIPLEIEPLQDNSAWGVMVTYRF